MRHFVTKASFIALLAAAPAVAFAQPSGSANAGMMSGQGMSGGGMSGGGMSGGGMGMMPGPNGQSGRFMSGPGGMSAQYGGHRERRAMRSPVNRQDRRFVAEAASAGLAEVEAGQMALKRAAEPAVSEFGRWMITDHTELNDTLSYDAERAGIAVPHRLSQKDREMLDHLRRFNGAEFDLHYVNGAVEAHKQALELFKEEAQSGANPILRGFAHHSEWILTQHLGEAQALGSIPQSSTARAAHMASAPLAPMPGAKRASPGLQAGTTPEVRRSIVNEGAKRIEKEGK